MPQSLQIGYLYTAYTDSIETLIETFRLFISQQDRYTGRRLHRETGYGRLDGIIFS